MKKPIGIEALKPSPRNPRVMSEWQRQALKKSLSKFGDLGGIVVNRRSGQLVGGHQRVEAFRGDPAAKVRIPEPRAGMARLLLTAIEQVMEGAR
jgi:hypothetical protein